MSKCPFGAETQKVMNEILGEIGGRIEFSQRFIVREIAGGEFKSLHGEEEIEGDILELCAERHYGEGHRFMDLVACMADDFQGIPANWKGCAEKSGLDMRVIDSCAGGEEGRKLLSASAGIAKAREIFASPTLVVGKYSLSGSRGKNEIMLLLCCSFEEGSAPAECPGALEKCPGRVPIGVKALTDSRCAKCGAYVGNVIERLGAIFTNISPIVLDFASEEGKELYKEAGGGYLPLFVLGREAAIEPRLPEIGEWIVPVGELLVLKAGKIFHPLDEICTNSVDDDNDGLLDCADESCAQGIECRGEIPATLDLFVMSKCPFGIEAEKAMREVLGEFGSALKFNLFFLVEVYAESEIDLLPPAERAGCEKMEDGNWYCTLHGLPEIEENLVQACARKYYGRKLKYMEFVACRLNEGLERCKKASLKGKTQPLKKEPARCGE